MAKKYPHERLLSTRTYLCMLRGAECVHTESYFFFLRFIFY